jgi:hypothetical protein
MTWSPTNEGPSTDDLSTATLTQCLKFSSGIVPLFTADEMMPDGPIVEDWSAGIDPMWSMNSVGAFSVIDVAGTLYAAKAVSNTGRYLTCLRRVKMNRQMVWRHKYRMADAGNNFYFGFADGGAVPANPKIGVYSVGKSSGTDRQLLGGFFASSASYSIPPYSEAFVNQYVKMASDGYHTLHGFTSTAGLRSTIIDDFPMRYLDLFNYPTRMGNYAVLNAVLMRLQWLANNAYYYPTHQPGMELGPVQVFPFGRFCASLCDEDEQSAITEWFTASGGAKLAAIAGLTPSIDTVGSGGTIRVYAQQRSTTNGMVAADLLGAADAWSDLGDAADGVSISGALAAFACRVGQQFRFKLVFSSTTGVLPPPVLTGLSLAWTSDVAAPGVPAVSRLISAAGPSGAGVAPRIDLASLPTGARAIEVEVDRQPSGGAWAGALPISTRNLIESGYDYLQYRGAQTTAEAASERNELRISVPGTWAVGDKVRARARAVDAAGNTSAWSATTDPVEMVESTYIPVRYDTTTMRARTQTRVRLTVRT